MSNMAGGSGRSAQVQVICQVTGPKKRRRQKAAKKRLFAAHNFTGLSAAN
jgi:hypothetical protein